MGDNKRLLWLTHKRLEKGLTQTEVAKRCNVTVGSINNIELGRRKPSGALAKKIATVLDVDMAKFYDEGKEQQTA